MLGNRDTFIDRYNKRLQSFGGNVNTASQNTATGYSANNDYAVGSRVYNGSSPSPQAGAGGVDPAGYQTRDNEANTRRKYLLKYLGGK